MVYGGEDSLSSSAGLLTSSIDPFVESLVDVGWYEGVLRQSAGRMARRVIATHRNNFFGAWLRNTFRATLKRKLSHGEYSNDKEWNNW